MPANNTLSGSSILELNSQAIDGGALVMITNNTKGSYQWNSESSSGTLQVGTSGGGCNLTFYEIFADSLGARISLKDPYSNSEPCRFTDLGKPVSANDTARMNTIGNQKLSPFGSPTEDQVLTFNSNSTAIWKEPTGGPATMARNTGYWTSNAITTLATSSGTYTANVLRAHPLLVYQRESINTIGVSVTTAAAGHCRYGIYSDNGTGYPSTLISGSDKLLSPNATGIISATYSPKITLTAGKYWEAYSCDVAPSVTAIAVGAVPNVMGSKSTDFTVQGTGWNKSPYTYPVSGLPTSFPTGAALLGNTQPPFIGLKVVS